MKDCALTEESSGSYRQVILSVSVDAVRSADNGVGAWRIRRMWPSAATVGGTGGDVAAVL
jgi:hypothetical protein